MGEGIKGIKSVELLFCLYIFFCSGYIIGQPLNPDDTEAAMALLKDRRAELLKTSAPPDAHLYLQMMDLGMWEEVEELLANDPAILLQALYAKARFAWLNNDFFASESWIKEIESIRSPSILVLLLKAQLEIEAWRLNEAEAICLKILETEPQMEAALLLLGKIHLLNKNYPKARALAEQVQQWNPSNADAYLLQADAHFWLQETEEAIAPLRKCLQLNPLHAEARFAYGYAIWRKVDATLLPQMAAQWEDRSCCQSTPLSHTLALGKWSYSADVRRLC